MISTFPRYRPRITSQGKTLFGQTVKRKILNATACTRERILPLREFYMASETPTKPRVQASSMDTLVVHTVNSVTIVLRFLLKPEFDWQALSI